MLYVPRKQDDFSTKRSKNTFLCVNKCIRCNLIALGLNLDLQDLEEKLPKKVHYKKYKVNLSQSNSVYHGAVLHPLAISNTWIFLQIYTSYSRGKKDKDPYNISTM